MRDTDEPVMLTEASDLSSFGFFQRPTCHQLLNAFSKIVVKRIQPGQRITVEVDGLTEYQVHIYVRSDGLAGCFTADKEYPARVAFAKLAELLDQFASDPQLRGWESETRPDAFAGWPPLGVALEECQDPMKFDKILKIQKDLDSTQQVLHQTIDNILERGEKLDDLVARSDELSATSKQFYKQARKTNSCCTIC
jgi:synaptobrevin family protein YKT6